MPTLTKGNVIVENIKVGDIHYEYGCGHCIESTVKTLPMPNIQDDGILWQWHSETADGTIIDYAVHSKCSHYGPNLYDTDVYCKIM